MTQENLKFELDVYPSNKLDVAIVEGWTNEHFYDIHANWTHISGDENYFEISLDLPMKFIFKYLWIRFKRLFPSKIDRQMKKLNLE